MPSLNPDDSPHVVRIVELSERTLGNPEAAKTWQEHPMHALNVQTPLEASQSEDDAHQVEQILLQAEQGMLG